MDVHCLCYFDMLLFCYMNMSYYAAREDAGDRRLAMQGGNFTGYGGGQPSRTAAEGSRTTAEGSRSTAEGSGTTITVDETKVEESEDETEPFEDDPPRLEPIVEEAEEPIDDKQNR